VRAPPGAATAHISPDGKGAGVAADPFTPFEERIVGGGPLASVPLAGERFADAP
jgi:hypothetical protein